MDCRTRARETSTRGSIEDEDEDEGVTTTTRERGWMRTRDDRTRAGARERRMGAVGARRRRARAGGASASGDAGGSGARDFRARYDAVREDACVVSSVEVRGNERTRDALVEREVRRVYEARTLDGIKDALFAANAALQEYGIFKDVSMVIDADAAGGEWVTTTSRGPRSW